MSQATSDFLLFLLMAPSILSLSTSRLFVMLKWTPPPLLWFRCSPSSDRLKSPLLDSCDGAGRSLVADSSWRPQRGFCASEGCDFR